MIRAAHALHWQYQPAHLGGRYMSTQLDPIISEFETQEQADSYDRWFRAKVQEALDSEKPALPHAEAMAKLDRLIEERRRQRIE